MLRSPLLRASVAAFAFTSSALPAGARMLEFAHCEAPGHVAAVSTDAPGDALAASAKAAVEPDPGRRLVAGPFDLFGRIVQGIDDIVFGVPGYAPEDFRHGLVVELPGAAPEGLAGQGRLWDAHDAGLLEGEFSDVQLLAHWTGASNILITRDVEVRVPADLEGLRIRVVGTDGAAVIEALGAVPVHVPAREIQASLATGLIDGVVGDPSAVREFDLDAVADSYTLNVPLGQTSFYLAMDRSAYDGLSDARKAAIQSLAGRSLSHAMADVWVGTASGIIEHLKASGDKKVYSLSAEERAAFADVVLPVTEALVAADGNEAVLSAMRAR